MAAIGRILLRLGERLHKELQAQAQSVGLSLNQLCCIRLELPSALEVLPKELPEAIRVARRIAGKDLVGISVFGSWAKGTQRDGSDLDLLIVLNPKRAIKRDIYRRWQTEAHDVGACEPHFVHLPTDFDRISGLWAEVAVDGLVVLDVEQKLRQHLSGVRRALVEGKMISKKLHGQNYWVRNEVA